MKTTHEALSQVIAEMSEYLLNMNISARELHDLSQFCGRMQGLLAIESTGLTKTIENVVSEKMAKEAQLRKRHETMKNEFEPRFEDGYAGRHSEKYHR